MNKDAFYFSHDSNARFDTKILKLRAKFGLEGYGFYFCLLEIMRDNSNYMFNCADIETIPLQLQIDCSKAKTMLDFCLSVGLFLQDKEKNIYSESFLKRMNKMNTLRAKRQEAGRKGGIAKAKLKQNGSIKEKKIKEKEKEIKINKNIIPKQQQKKFIKPLVEDIQAYCLERKNGIDAQHFYNYYQSKGWLIGKTPMKDWKAAVRTWEINSKKDKPIEQERPYNAML